VRKGAVLRSFPVLAIAALTACAPWRSDIELTPGVAASPVLEVQGWQSTPRRPGVRQIAFGPWTAERRPGREAGWYMTLRHDSVETGSAWCRVDAGPGDPRQKGRRQEVPQEVFACDIALAQAPDTLRLEVKGDAGHPLVGQAQSEDWEIGLRGTDHLRTRSCLLMPTCGWYLTLDGMDIAAVEADARAWVYISPNLGDEVRTMAALIAATLLLRADPVQRFPGGPQQPMIAEPAAAHLTLPGSRASS
jgi:hypothetical protein